MDRTMDLRQKKIPTTDAPWYEEILLHMDFGRLPLRSYCDDTYSLILMIHTSFEREGMVSIGVVTVALQWKSSEIHKE